MFTTLYALLLLAAPGQAEQCISGLEQSLLMCEEEAVETVGQCEAECLDIYQDCLRLPE